MAKKIRVLHTEVGGVYGGSLRALELYLQFADPTRFEHDVLLYYPTPGYEQIVPLVERVHTLYDFVPDWLTQPSSSNPLKRAVMRTPVAELGKWLELFDAARNASNVRALLKKLSYDLVHVNNTFTFQPGMLIASRSLGTPVLSHVRNPVPKTLLNRILIRSVGTIVTVSRNYEKELLGWGAKIPVYTCHDGVIVPAADPIQSSRIRASFVSAGETLIGSVGRLHVQKGYDTLLHAARIIVNDRPDIKLAIAGEGPMRRELEDLVHTLGLADNVHLCGFRGDIPDFISALDLFVSSSNWEGLPIAVVESMLLMRPVVATDVGGVSEVVKPGSTGYLVPPSDPQALAVAVLRALEDRESHAGISLEAAQELAAKLTDPELSARGFERRIEQFLKL